MTVDTEFGEVHVDGRRVALSPTEFSVLQALVAEGGSVVPADRLARQAWSEPVSANLVQVYISYLRRKIGPERIRTVRGGGYALDPSAASCTVRRWCAAGTARAHRPPSARASWDEAHFGCAPRGGRYRGNDSAAASNVSFSSGVETVTRTPSGWNGRTTTFW